MAIDKLSFIGKNLKRPECVLTTRSGNIYVSDFRGGVSQIHKNGQHTFYGGEIDDYGLLQPNGIALLEDGSFLVAHLGADCGGVFQITRDNTISPVLTQLDGAALPPTNFVHLDYQGRIWITVSTRHKPRALAYRSDVKDGFIAVIDHGEARIVAEGIGYTNELYVTPDGDTLYVNATFSRELIRYRIAADNTLISPHIICTFAHGTFPDGLTMDSHGQLWVASIISNRLIRINPDNGTQSVLLEDSDHQHLEWVEQAYQNNTMGREHLDATKSNLLKNISSLAFGNEDLCTVYMGCLLGSELAVWQSEVPGMPSAHWRFDG